MVAKSFKELGIKKGDIVTMAMATTPEMVYILYALNRIEQYETEQRISEFEQKINDDENQVVTDTVDASNTTEQAV